MQPSELKATGNIREVLQIKGYITKSLALIQTVSIQEVVLHDKLPNMDKECP